MSRLRVVLVALLLAVISIGCATARAEAPTEPPHVEPRTGASEAVALAAAWDAAAAQAAWIEGVRQGEWFAGVERAERERLAAVARSTPVRSPSGNAPAGGDCAALAAQLGLSEAILWRESRCQWGAYNVTGCSGRGCVGPAQIDTGHFAQVSPWNPGAQGTCYGLDSSDEVQYALCVERLPDSAWR